MQTLLSKDSSSLRRPIYGALWAKLFPWKRKAAVAPFLALDNGYSMEWPVASYTESQHVTFKHHRRFDLQRLTLLLLTTWILPVVTWTTVLMAAVSLASGTARAQTKLRPLLGNSNIAIHSLSPILVFTPPDGEYRIVAILDKRHELLLFEETEVAFEFRSAISIDTPNCHSIKLVETRPTSLLLICPNSLKLVDLESQTVRSLGIDGFVLEANVDTSLGRILALTSQGGGYNFGSKTSWLSQDPTTAKTQIQGIDIQSLELQNLEVLHESCYNGKLAVDSLRGPLAFCIKSSKRNSRTNSAISDTTVTLISKHFKITKRFMDRNTSHSQSVVGHTSHRRIPTMLRFSGTGLVAQVNMIELAPIDPPHLTVRRAQLALKSPLSTSSGQPQVMLKDVDSDLLDELVVAESDGIEVFKSHRGQLQSIGYVSLGRDSLSNHSFSEAQLSLDKAQGSLEILYLASSKSGWHIASSRLR